TTDQSAPTIVLGQVARSVFLPIQTRPSAAWYRNDRPFIGFPMAPFLVIGVVIMTLGFWQRRYFGIAAAYWITAVGLGLTEDPTQTQRIIIAAPLYMIGAAIGLVALARIAHHVIGIRRTIVEAALAAVVVGLAVWNLEYYFMAPSQSDLFGGNNSMVATRLADDLRSMPGKPTVYLFG